MFWDSLWAFWAENKIVEEIIKNRKNIMLKKTHIPRSYIMMYAWLCLPYIWYYITPNLDQA